MNLPPSPLLHYDSPPPRAGGYSRVALGISWLVIAVAILSAAIVNWRAARAPGRAEAVQNVQLTIASRVVVGEFHAINQARLPTAVPAEQLLSPLKRVATEPEAKLRLVSVIGEVKGRGAALAAIDDVSPKLSGKEAAADVASLRTIYTRGPAALSGDQREGLVRNEGWFGNLALTFGLADSDALRHATLAKARAAFIGSAALELLVALAGLAGLVLMLVAIIRLALGRLHLSYRPAAGRTTAFIEAFALYLGGYVAISLTIRRFFPHSLALGTLASLGWIVLAMFWPLARGVSWAGLKGGYGWYRGQGILREALAGLVGYLAGLPLVIFAVVVSFVLISRSGTTTSHPVMFAQTHGFWNILELYLLASVFAPLAEETLFRGALFNHLRQWHGWVLAALVSSFIFAAVHPQGWAAIPVLGGIGFVFAGIREWRGTFVASATAHAVHNGIAVTVLIVSLQ